MKVLLWIAFRNLFRQKRRNLFLGSAIALGTMVLLLANAFSAGISDTLINRVVVYVAGHVNVQFAYEGQIMSQMMRGGRAWKERFARLPHVKRVEEGMGIFGRAIGNGKSDNAVLVGVVIPDSIAEDELAKLQDNFPMEQGAWESLRDSTVENPLILTRSKAEYLRVAMGDVVKMRFQDMHGRFVAVRLTVVGIGQPSNLFMEGVMFMPMATMAALMGMRPEDAPMLQITVDEPENYAATVADSVWELFAHPPLAAVPVRLASKRSNEALADATLLAVRSDSAALTKWTVGWKRGRVLISDSLAALGVAVGDTLRATNALRFPMRNDSLGHWLLVAGGIFPVARYTGLPPHSVLFQDRDFYTAYHDNLPPVEEQRTAVDAARLDRAVRSVLATEWILLPRPRTTEAVQKNKREISQGIYHGTAISVSSMYESASQILQFEAALQIITFGAVLVIFFIILIGVVNTLRMTVRERTREIGTLRAIGMQRGAVRLVFLFETGLLALFSSVAGVLASFVAMLGLSALTLAAAGNPLGIILVRGHLVFAPSVFSTVGFVLLIVLIAVATAWFPASRAAQLTAAAALRHFE